MIKEVAVILLFGMFGWEIAFINIVTGFTIAITAGYAIGKLQLEHWVQDWVYETQIGSSGDSKEKLKPSDRIRFGYNAVKKIVG